MDYTKTYEEWVKSSYFDEDTKLELDKIKDNEKEIEDRFYKDLEFGTAGLRGVIEAGTNRINKYTVRRATFGLANYILENTTEEEKNRGVVIAHDNRHKSREFCIESANTLAACGIKAYIFDSLRTTPELSFAVRNLNAIAGIVITASHNPPEYNGYKVYWEDGAQVMPDIANAITEKVNSIHDYSIIPTLNEANKNLVVLLDETQDTEFIEAVKSQVIRKDLVKSVGKNFKIVYTPLCGTGNIPIRRALKEVGFENILVVPEEENPDPNFAGLDYPNPEEKKALNRGILLAKEKGADLVIATDPDCDRVGVAVRTTTGEYVLLTGNQIGGMLTHYIIEGLKENNQLKENPTMIKTIVTSEFGADIAKENNVDVLNVLTGFKFIGEKIKLFEENKDRNYVFGYEESYGYLVGTHARDKDGVVSSLLISEMAAFYYSKGMSLYEGLIELYKKYGFFKEQTISLTLKGIEGVEKIKEIISYFRENQIDCINNIKVIDKKDYKNGVDNLPKSDVLKYFLEDESWVAIRPSGTEPKLKFYIAVKGTSDAEADEKLRGLKEYIDIMVSKLK
ncbi:MULTISPECIES: phospho-sugar mutase [unclassified Clostridioides]|uniref:phospho-sugar mutase n=1 Tax=unclassified Clostridioides TaxID=2635829 RepID=UPI001D0C3AF2|nr:phospho-sugar mutase [Clostridioides sp. ES-S-0049-03]MCC0673259.1 phospho-sugar mutase [Clostridioides sp. ES-S-0145-01]MCC0674642.1 phospho-sugar mutase [Clostridioides sp. ES-W-0018-02]MCC0679165.1 phospho-sugar mutase [Clostridioides sp. ES-S-0005-03]MCC0708652.1 phospho-sugar mutase [Clostridioides sp. ES-S-0190-01]MCC0710543.1 phospho-sugar mutase [Clostridioides sp. ES-W-0017-02]MCC0761966.1 phospho-sugar mutase [Clostridioides sp. ES-S-0006-03]UDN48969.1 phospho-sugar mutase [Clos